MKEGGSMETPKPGPGDFPLGSMESRAAARAMINRKDSERPKPLPLGMELLYD